MKRDRTTRPTRKRPASIEHARVLQKKAEMDRVHDVRMTPALQHALGLKHTPEFTTAVDLDDILLADYVVCVLAIPPMALMLQDNVIDFCCKCDRKVQLRPYVPQGPRRICYECIVKFKNKPHTIMSAPGSNLAEDFRAWLRTRKP